MSRRPCGNGLTGRRKRHVITHLIRRNAFQPGVVKLICQVSSFICRVKNQRLSIWRIILSRLSIPNNKILPELFWRYLYRITPVLF